MSDYDVTRRQIRVIPTGVDAAGEFNPARLRPHSFPGTPSVRILFAGRLVDQKDPLLMIEIIRRLVMRRGDVHVEVVGEGPIESDLRRRCREYGLERHVTLHGPTRDLAPWLAGADLLLLTSEFEGVPYVAYEALAMGMPVVAPALPGMVELIDPGGGALIEPRDDVDAYVEALIGLIDDGPHRRRLGADARSRSWRTSPCVAWQPPTSTSTTSFSTARPRPKVRTTRQGRSPCRSRHGRRGARRSCRSSRRASITAAISRT